MFWAVVTLSVKLSLAASASTDFQLEHGQGAGLAIRCRFGRDVHDVNVCILEGCDVAGEHRQQGFLATTQKLTGWTKDKWRTYFVRSDRWSKRIGEEVQEQVAEQEQDKKVRFREEEQPEETRAQSTNEQDVTSGFEDVRTGTGRAGLVRGGDETCRTDETSGEGEGKGNGGEEEHGGKGKFGSKEARQDAKKDEEDDQVQVAPNRSSTGRQEKRS